MLVGRSVGRSVGWLVGRSVTKTNIERFFAIPLPPTRPRLGGVFTALLPLETRKRSILGCCPIQLPHEKTTEMAKGVKCRLRDDLLKWTKQKQVKWKVRSFSVVFWKQQNHCCWSRDGGEKEEETRPDVRTKIAHLGLFDIYSTTYTYT